jgi:DNA-binding transcriptional regulator YhcF (GntR family)
MATLGELGEIVTRQMRERVDRLVSAVADEGADLAEVSRLAEAIGALAGTIGDAYRELEQALMGRLQEQQQRHDEQPVQEQSSQGENVTKEELLEEARELHIEGRSSMSKEELAEAVETEENVTKEELLERARRADIEGRSGMTKEELRKALSEANT